MTSRADIIVNSANEWRTETPGAPGWDRSVHPDAAKKYFMISVDTHLSPPPKLFRERIDARFRDRLPRIEEKDGRRYIVQEGNRPMMIAEPVMEGEDLLRTKSGGAPNLLADLDMAEEEKKGLERIADQELDGVDGEVIFPNGPALLMWSSPDPEFVTAQARIWNDWAMEVCAPVHDRCKPAAALAPADLEQSIAEVKRVAKLGYKAVMLPLRPNPGPRTAGEVNYNLPHFDPLWAAIEEHELVICYHVATGIDPRTASGDGGAIINYVVHSNAPTMEPIVGMCAAGVFERFPKLKAGTIEANAGWLPWMMDQMDESFRKHHFWIRPRLRNLPSDYFRSNCFASIAEDRSALLQCEEYGLSDNLMWANDYPHHEGSWPHSAEAIERTFRDYVTEDSRAKILGLNAARVFGFPVPERYRD